MREKAARFIALGTAFVGTILTILVLFAIWTLTQRANRMAQERIRREDR
jgi:Na+-transporting methylmalonyl-CoA/oxaloacetate decarboxylase gamma subunit